MDIDNGQEFKLVIETAQQLINHNNMTRQYFIFYPIEIDMANKISVVVGDKEQKTEFDFEWELGKYLNTTFMRLDADIVLMDSPLLISCYNAEIIDLTNHWKKKNVGDADIIVNQPFSVCYSLLCDYLRAEEAEILKENLYVKCKDRSANNNSTNFTNTNNNTNINTNNNNDLYNH